MTDCKTALQGIPTHVITGFLGVGKSTAILHLLRTKPDGERWAVLVNEFGEVGIDGSLIGGQLSAAASESSGVFIREVPGGCMCCAAGVPMRAALNALLKHARPDRLLVEPTGLGHPREVLETLSGADYAQVLDVQATVTLVDARKVHDARYTGHDTFNQQLAVADVIVANKADQYASADFPALLDYLGRGVGLDDKLVRQVTGGALELDWLTAAPREHAFGNEHVHHHHQHEAEQPTVSAGAVSEDGYRRIDNAGDGHVSRGWIFDTGWCFDARRLAALLAATPADRIKGVVQTDQGVTAYNAADGQVSQTRLSRAADSRLECISTDPDTLQRLEDGLLDCVIASRPHVPGAS